MQNQNIISHNKPEIFDKLHDKFGVEWEDVIITCYPYIHSKKPFNDIKYVHELQHLLQQEKYGVEDWFDMYLRNKDFRKEQELEAYLQEIAFIRENVSDRNELYQLTRKIYKDLSSPMYDLGISFEEARDLLS